MLSILGMASPFSEDCTALALSTASYDTAISNVFNDDLTRLWRAATTDAIARFSFSSNRYLSLDSIFISGHNLNGLLPIGSGLVTPLDSWQIWVSNDPGYDVFQVPSSVQEATNLTAAAGFVSYDYRLASGVAAYVQTTPATLSRLRVRFANPAPLTVTSLPASPVQTFGVAYATRGSGSITLTARLKEAGTLRSTLTSGALAPSASPTFFNLFWAGSLLTGAVPELELEVSTSGTAAVDWYPIRWDATLPNSQPSHFTSGLTQVILAPNYRPQDMVSLSSACFLPAAQQVKRLFIRLNRTGAGVDAGPQGGFPAEVGRIDGGLRIRSSMSNRSWKIGLDTASLGNIRVMRDGSERITPMEPRLLAEVQNVPEKIATALAEKLALGLQGGIHRGYFWCFDDDDPTKAPYTWFFGRMTVPPELSDISRLYRTVRSGFSVKQIR